MNTKFRMVTVLVLSLVLVGSTIGFPLAAGVASAQETNTTATATSTPTPTASDTTTAAACEDPSLPQMDAARLYAPTQQIEAGQPGRIEGGFDLDNQAECPVVVEVRLMVQSGMSVSGGSDWGSTAAGMVSTEFTITPDGSDTEDIAANVYSRNTGEARVDAEIEYWPKGHPEMSQNLDSQRFYFDVTEPATETATGGTGGGSDGSSILSGLSNLDSEILLFFLAALAIVGMMYIAPKLGINLGK